jgi:hypothetical protein
MVSPCGVGPILKLFKGNIMSLNPTTKLEAVNMLLEGIMESPVNSVDGSGLQEADLASVMIDRVSREVQKKGWHWNTLINYVITPDTDGNIVLPKTTLGVDTMGKSAYLDLVQRADKLYNRETNTFNIGSPVTVELVLNLPYEELPENARWFIAVRATRKFQQKQLGSSELSEFDRTDEQDAYFDMIDEEADTRDYNMLRDSASVMRILNRTHFSGS